MTIKVGDKIPSLKLVRVTDKGPAEVTTDELFKGKTTVMFGVPGAFTSTCSVKHLPGYLQQADALKAKGVDNIVCMAVNDASVMEAWSKDRGTGGMLEMLADGSAMLTKALGVEFDLTARHMGVRSRRFALVAKDGVVTHMALEPVGEFGVSSAEEILKAL